MSYTQEQTQEMIAEYKENPTAETAKAIAERLGKPFKSIVGKLSYEGVYVRQNYVTKTGDPVETKLEIVADIEQLLQLEDLVTLEKTSKAVLVKLRGRLTEIFEPTSENSCETEKEDQ